MTEFTTSQNNWFRTYIMFRHALFIIPTFILFTLSAIGQERKILLQDAIRIAQQNSFEYKVAKNRLKSSTWRFSNYMASFLPTLYLDGNIPNYTRAITKITLPNGEDTFVNQNQAYSSLNLGIQQNVGLTGGVFAVGSTLNRIDVLGGSKQVLYSSTPFSISYRQQAIGYNSFKWQKQIEPLRFESSERQFISDMERISSQTVLYYFNTLSAQARLSLSRQNLAHADTLYRITLDRFRLGNVAQSDLLQLRLNTLNARKQMTQDSMEYVLANQQFSRYLLLPDNVVLDFVDSVTFFNVEFDQALQHAMNNSQNVINFRLQRLEAEQQVAETKAQSGLKFNVLANFGVSNTASRIGRLLNGMENQQQVSLGFSLPILDWGYAKTQRQRSEANLAMVESEIEQQHLQLEQEMALYTARWNLHKQQLLVAKETRTIALQNYELEMDRFLRGTITINDLNAAQQQKDNAANTYIDAIKVYWELFYTIRRLTLFDFQTNQKIFYKH